MKPIDLELEPSSIDTPSVKNLARRLNQNNPQPPYEVEEVQVALQAIATEAILAELIGDLNAWQGERGDTLNGTPIEDSAYGDQVQHCEDCDSCWFYLGRGEDPDRVEFVDPQRRCRIQDEQQLEQVARREARDFVQQRYEARLMNEVAQRA